MARYEHLPIYRAAFDLAVHPIERRQPLILVAPTNNQHQNAYSAKTS